MNLLIHVEDSRMVGILPSQLDSIRLLAQGLGIKRLAFVDGTVDGVFRTNGWERFGKFSDWKAQVVDPIIVFSPNEGTDVRELEAPEDAWLIFGPAMGFDGTALADLEVTMATIPVNAILNSRDAVPIALWELAG